MGMCAQKKLIHGKVSSSSTLFSKLVSVTAGSHFTCTMLDRNWIFSHTVLYRHLKHTHTSHSLGCKKEVAWELHNAQCDLKVLHHHKFVTEPRRCVKMLAESKEMGAVESTPTGFKVTTTVHRTTVLLFLTDQPDAAITARLVF